MKDLKTKYPKLYAEWVSSEPASLAEAKQEWEDEGGSVDASIKPVGVKPTPKLPL